MGAALFGNSFSPIPFLSLSLSFSLSVSISLSLSLSLTHSLYNSLYFFKFLLFCHQGFLQVFWYRLCIYNCNLYSCKLHEYNFAHTGQILIKYCSNTGQILIRHWSSTGQTRGSPAAYPLPRGRATECTLTSKYNWSNAFTGGIYIYVVVGVFYGHWWWPWMIATPPSMLVEGE